LEAADALRIRWLDTFGNLIGNTGRHLGNLAFYCEPDALALRLAPIYDMLPMVFAPSGATVVEREYVPLPPTAETLDVWRDAAEHAAAYWRQLVACAALSEDMRRRAAGCLSTLAALQERVPLT
jgi:hypothetical protein